jgi:hypothetical protein
MAGGGERTRQVGEGIDPGSKRGISQRGLQDLGAVFIAAAPAERDCRAYNRRYGRVKEASRERFEGRMVSAADGRVYDSRESCATVVRDQEEGTWARALRHIHQRQQPWASAAEPGKVRRGGSGVPTSAGRIEKMLGREHLGHAHRRIPSSFFSFIKRSLTLLLLDCISEVTRGT